MDLRKMYQHQELDLDNNYYWVINADVKMYRNEDKRINAIFKRFKEREEQKLYIKGNRLFFTLKGVKYYEILCYSSWEWENIADVIKELQKIASFVCYDMGELD